MVSTDPPQEAVEENGLNGALQWLVGAASWSIGFIGAGAVILEARAGGSAAAMWVFLIFGWAPVIFAHELGHALAALAVGWRVLVFHVAPCALRTRPLRVTFAGSLGGPDLAGAVFACPVREAERTRLRDMAFSAGGPIASLVLALSLIPWALSGTDIALVTTLRELFEPAYAPSYAPADMPRAIIAGFGFYSLAGFVLSAIPLFDRDEPRNDAALFVTTLRTDLRPATESALRLAQTMWRLGIPPRFWPAWVHAGLDDLRHDASTAPATYSIDFLVALDGGDIAALRDRLEDMRREYPQSADVLTACAFLAACIDLDADAATATLPARADLSDAAWWFTEYLWQLTSAALAAHAGESAMREARLEAVRRASSSQPLVHAFWVAQIARVRAQQ